MDLHNKVAGIIGTGKIGVCMANICKGYGIVSLNSLSSCDKIEIEG